MTYMNYHGVRSVTISRKQNHQNEDGSEYGVVQLTVLDKEGNAHTIALFYENPLTDEQLDEPTL